MLIKALINQKTAPSRLDFWRQVGPVEHGHLLDIIGRGPRGSIFRSVTECLCLGIQTVNGLVSLTFPSREALPVSVRQLRLILVDS